MNLGLHN
jgi:hypothetical protein